MWIGYNYELFAQGEEMTPPRNMTVAFWMANSINALCLDIQSSKHSTPTFHIIPFLASSSVGVWLSHPVEVTRHIDVG